MIPDLPQVIYNILPELILTILLSIMGFGVVYLFLRQQELQHKVTVIKKNNFSTAKNLEGISFDVNNLLSLINDKLDTNTYNSLVEAHNRVVEKLNSLTDKVKYVEDSWRTEWDSANDWKKGCDDNLDEDI